MMEGSGSGSVLVANGYISIRAKTFRYTFYSTQVPYVYQGIARTQSPTIRNYAFELPTFGVIVGVNPTVVQWPGLTLEEPPS
jgi:hypothetical protein